MYIVRYIINYNTLLMISMTGYTKKQFKINNTKFSIFIKSLNSSKGLDVSIKTPRYLLDLEPEIKKIIDKELIRGKIDIKVLDSHTTSTTNLDEHKVKKYIQVLTKISPKSKQGQLLNAAVSMPDIFTSNSLKMTLKNKKQFVKMINNTVLDLVKYRTQEGRKLKQEIKLYINSIIKIAKELMPLEKARKIRKREKILKQLKSIPEMEYSSGRLESEMIYYFEKYDITEERVRLEYHCKFFLQILRTEKLVGKKLNFLSQEILREINTIGSKANDFEIQKRVVQMKEEIDKTKEQLQNVL
mgnify:CR=1 FL=1